MVAKKLTDDEVKTIIQEAQAEAKRFTKAYIEQNGEHFPCGFAWVTIRPARGQFVKVMKQMNVGDKGWETGWCVWNPSGNGTQCMDAKVAGARAFADALKKHGIDVSVGQRMD